MTHPLFAGNTDYTIGELGTAIFAIHDPKSAKSFFEDYVQWARIHAHANYQTDEGARRLARANIGWFFGEGMPQIDINMWVKACGAVHPVFGNMATPPTPEEAFYAGRDWVDKS